MTAPAWTVIAPEDRARVVEDYRELWPDLAAARDGLPVVRDDRPERVEQSEAVAS
ncbi:hypothetical protein O7626_39630 [Micromonospora sp. WMMD1102]|uniref:hypothetical protein n=1 Tax=Micromonospora sp. WMMD1102 TaxID=3016105 RepID=UPI0024151777|nr:hypothetical protein [Micromonospora sp. WMMD1102]MDG4791926.1 hypothetical protein [Micromonospora sp. WMMD1102]